MISLIDSVGSIWMVIFLVDETVANNLLCVVIILNVRDGEITTDGSDR